MRVYSASGTMVWTRILLACLYVSSTGSIPLGNSGLREIGSRPELLPIPSARRYAEYSHYWAVPQQAFAAGSSHDTRPNYVPMVDGEPIKIPSRFVYDVGHEFHHEPTRPPLYIWRFTPMRKHHHPPVRHGQPLNTWLGQKIAHTIPREDLESAMGVSSQDFEQPPGVFLKHPVNNKDEVAAGRYGQTQSSSGYKKHTGYGNDESNQHGKAKHVESGHSYFKPVPDNSAENKPSGQHNKVAPGKEQQGYHDSGQHNKKVAPGKERQGYHDSGQHNKKVAPGKKEEQGYYDFEEKRKESKPNRPVKPQKNPEKTASKHPDKTEYENSPEATKTKKPEKETTGKHASKTKAKEYESSRPTKIKGSEKYQNQQKGKDSNKAHKNSQNYNDGKRNPPKSDYPTKKSGPSAGNGLRLNNLEESSSRDHDDWEDCDDCDDEWDDDCDECDDWEDCDDECFDDDCDDEWDDDCEDSFGRTTNDLDQEELKEKFMNSVDSKFRSLVFNPMAEAHEKFQSCKTPTNESGSCRYIQHCLLSNIIGAIGDFMSYVCIINDRFIGVCCPEFPVTVVNVKWDETVHSGNESASGKIESQKECGVSSKTRVVGGSKADPAEYPWMAALLTMSKGQFFCGGSIINDRYILTAAHCTFGIPRNQILVRLGEYDFGQEDPESPGEDYPVVEIKRHALYSRRTLQHDIALLKLGRPINFSKRVGTICLPKKGEDFIGETATLAGWGNTKGGGPSSEVLLEAALEIVNNTICAKEHGLPVPDTFICTRSEDMEKGACNGDSGGPLMLMNEETKIWKIVGLVSWGRRGCEPKFPTVYTRITEYLNWIDAHDT